MSQLQMMLYIILKQLILSSKNDSGIYQIYWWWGDNISR